jgi:hypothetical protein
VNIKNSNHGSTKYNHKLIYFLDKPQFHSYDTVFIITDSSSGLSAEYDELQYFIGLKLKSLTLGHHMFRMAENVEDNIFTQER